MQHGTQLARFAALIFGASRASQRAISRRPGPAFRGKTISPDFSSRVSIRMLLVMRRAVW